MKSSMKCTSIHDIVLACLFKGETKSTWPTAHKL
uniref:Uncharacterized protein n=1 Tax=Arundo donax TaxID=35708 RepID=A0A0A9PTP2_ARUDO